MHRTICDPIVRRNRPRWLNTIAFTVAALIVGSAAIVAAQSPAESALSDLSPAIKAEVLAPPHVPSPITRRMPAKVLIELDTVEKHMPLADGVQYEFCTFNGSVPGPFLRVRIFFGVGGPNITSSFHVLGEIFDTVYPEGASEAQHHLQTTLAPAGGAAIVELTFQVPGTYVLVAHSLSRVIKGAVGSVVVEGHEAPEVYGKLPGM
jgi:hypothetical protein